MRANSKSKARTILAVGLIVATVLSASVLYYIWSMQNSSDQNDYKPTHRPGIGTEDFWTTYPNDHVLSGQTVPFPTWVSENTSSRVLLVMVHSECGPCLQHQKNIQQILADPTYNTSVSYIDILIDASNPRTSDYFDIFDPEGHTHNIPLTIIVLRTPDGKYIWHSFEGVTGKANLEVWLKDSIYYMHTGVGG
jgi:hypothetical protein